MRFRSIPARPRTDIDLNKAIDVCNGSTNTVHLAAYTELSWCYQQIVSGPVNDDQSVWEFPFGLSALQTCYA